MARTKSPLNLRGSIKGLSFYSVEGSDETFVREKGGANINHIRNSKSFSLLRLEQNELRGRAALAKDLRITLGQWSWRIVDRHLQLRLCALLKIIQKMDEVSPRGKRSIYVTKHKELLRLINYYYYKPLSDLLLCPYTVETSEDKKTLTVKLKGLNPKLHVKAPVQASHFQLCISIGTISDCICDLRNGTYHIPFGENRDWGSEKESEWIPLDGPVMDEFSINVSLHDFCTVKDNQVVIQAFGIVFGKMMYTVEPIKKDRGSIVILDVI